MKTNQAGIALIKKFEGFVGKEYRCPAGLPTIGYGHVIQEGEKFPKTITEQEAHDLLIKDLPRYEMAVKKVVKVELNENQFSALVSFVYNLGPAAFLQSTLLKRINAREFTRAADEFDKWVFAKVKGVSTKLPGLERRREAEKNLFLAEVKQ